MKIIVELPDNMLSADGDHDKWLAEILVRDALHDFVYVREGLHSAREYVATRYEWMSPERKELKVQEVMLRCAIARQALVGDD